MKITAETKGRMLQCIVTMTNTDPRAKDVEAVQYDALDELKTILETADDRNKRQRTMAKAWADATIWIMPRGDQFEACDSTGKSVPDTLAPSIPACEAIVRGMQRPGGFLEHVRSIAPFRDPAATPRVPVAAAAPPMRPARRMRVGSTD